MTTRDEAPPQPRSAPTHWRGILGQLGPGLIISAVIVGSGELIVTPKLGAELGFSLLWFIIVGCFIKVFIQVELGRFAISNGKTTLEALNLVPGPRWVVSWLVWLWLIMYVALVLQVAGMVGALATVMKFGGLNWPTWTLTLLVASACAVLLVVGRYRMVERISTAMVVLFTLTTLIAVGALQSTSFAVTPAQFAGGFTFHLPDSLTTAFAAFGVIGVGASELIYYPYWCLEKGYARHVGASDGTSLWRERAVGWVRVMRVDAWFSFVIYTTATVAFYLLGAAVLGGKGLEVESDKMIETLSHMYRETFGEWSLWVFLVGAFAVLFSTVFCATASNSRLFADALSLYGVVRYKTGEERQKMIRVGCVLLSTAFFVVYMLVKNPVGLVLVGAIVQGLMLPFLAGAALYFRYRRTEPALQPGRIWTFFLWLAAAAMAALGVYMLIDKLSASFA